MAPENISGSRGQSKLPLTPFSLRRLANMTTDLNDTNDETDHWTDDVLGRKHLATFLTKSTTELAQLRMKSHGAGLTIALDSDWGTGKSFFVRHWASDLQDQGYPVVVFDAWENDIGDEAAVALMASIKSEMESWKKKLPHKKIIRQKANLATNAAIQGLRRAILPASKVIAAGVLKKATGIAVEEIFEAFSSPANDASISISSPTSSQLESGLDEIFKRSLEEHHKKGTAIKEFKKAISQLIHLLETEAKARTPVFVFVDEVDRCRPTYAIRLLEEIKHIFGVPKICFVVSTNLDQLRESVCAIYGAGFDGHRYLKRFFDHQYTLPEPDNESFSAQLLTQESPISHERAVSGLPNRPAASSTKRAIAAIANAFDLDLRSQKQVFNVANSVAAVIPNDKKIFVLWLFFLCALQHKSPHLLKRLAGNKLNAIEFKSLCQEALHRDIEIDYLRSRTLNNYESRDSTGQIFISETLLSYYEWSIDDLIKLSERLGGTNMYDYPASNFNEFDGETPNPYKTNTKYPPSIANYAEWVRYAGMENEI